MASVILTVTRPPFPFFQDLRRKAARLVAAKCTLAARVDSFHESTEGKVRGRRLSSWAVGCPGRAIVLTGGVRVPLRRSPLLLANDQTQWLSTAQGPELTGLSQGPGWVLLVRPRCR